MHGTQPDVADPVTPLPASPDLLLATTLDVLADTKAEDIVRIDLRGKSAVADEMVIASGRSVRQVIAISEKLAEALKRRFGVRVRPEGKSVGDWVLIDTGDVIVHIFRPEVRAFYQLEKMWSGPFHDLAGGGPAS